MGKQKNLRRIDFEIKHIDLMEMREDEAIGIMQMDNIYEKISSAAQVSKECSTFTADGKIICCAGYYELWDGVVEVWIIPSVHVSDYVRSFARVFRDAVDSLINEKGYHRVQTSCANDALHHRWMKWLKMEPEGIMRNYTSYKEDYCMFSRIN